MPSRIDQANQQIPHSHSIFDRNWTVDTTNKQILDTVFGLLLVPEFSDPINTVVTLNYYWDEVAFKDEVQKHIRKYANKSRQELGAEILGDGGSSDLATAGSSINGIGEGSVARGISAREAFGSRSL